MHDRHDLTLAIRFWRNVDISEWEADPSGHWYWTGSRAGYKRLTDGYGRLSGRQGNRRVTLYAHRLSHQLHKGPIPDGYFIDHLCGVTVCVNPDHIEAVTPSQNVTRARRHSAYTRNGGPGHCAHGHRVEGTNAYQYASGRRRCRICTLASQRRRYRERNG